MNDRIQLFIESQGVSIAEFERICGLSNGAVSKMGDGTRRSTIDKISNHYPSLNKTWLLTGEGEMLINYKSSEHEDSPEASLQEPVETKVPLVPLNALGGTLVGFSEDSVRLSDCEMVKTPVDNVEFAIPIYGESMLPYYPSGCRVFVKKIDMSSYIIWGNVYVLDTTNGIILKEVQPSNREDYILCHSLNPSGKFKDFEVPLKDIRGMYRVMACLIAM